MADIINLQELADAKLDAQSLERFINGGVNEEVLTRLSQQYPTMQNFLFQFQKYNSRAYKTYALMDADKASIPAKSKVTVTNDATTSNNGDWQWDGAVFTKSAYDPLAQAKADATAKAEAAKNDAITAAATDASTKAQAAEANAKLAAQNTDVKLLTSIQQIVDAITQFRNDYDIDIASLIAMMNSTDTQVNTRITRILVSFQQMLQIVSENRDEFDSIISANTTSISSLLAEDTVINTRISRIVVAAQQTLQMISQSREELEAADLVLANDDTLINTRITRVLVSVQQLTQLILENRDDIEALIAASSGSLSAEDLLINTRLTRLNVALQSFMNTVSQLVNDDLSDAILYFADQSKLNRLLIQQDLSIQLSKFENFDPADAGSNKYVEAEKIVFFPAPQNIIRIDIETSQALPTAKGTVINTTTAINVDGQILKNYGTLEVQGSSSASFPKKNWTICLFSDEARTTAIKIKLGHMIMQEELVFKANFVDNTHTRNIACNRLWQQFVDSRVGFPKSEVDAVNMLNSDLTVENYSGLSYAPTDATGHVDGFPAAIYINSVFYGIGTLNIGKKRDNYNLDKNTQKHIQVEPQGNWTGGISYTNLPEHPDDANSTFGTYFEIRRPSSWKAEAQGYWTRLRAYTSLSREDMQTAGIDNYFNRKNLMDYIILMQLCDLWDHLGKNSLITTWNGNVWNFMPYDLDTVFGLDWLGNFYNENGAAKHPANGVLIGQNLSAGNAGFFSKCRRIYGVDIDARYAALRRAKIIDVDNIIQLCEDILRKFPTDLLKAENSKWNTGSTSIYTSLLQTSSIHQIQSWLSVHIPVVDSYFNYTA